jgi:cytochrome P450
MATYFEPISVLSLARVLGLGDLDADTLRGWFKGMNLGATNFERDPVKQAAADAICAQIDDVVVPRMHALLTAPDATTMSDLLHAARSDGLGPRPIDLVLPSLKVALLGGMQEPGHGAGTVLAGLFTRPDQFDELRNDPALLTMAVDEGLRWIAPIGTQIRTATRDVEIAGTQIPRGATVSAILASANRDGTKYPNADVFDLHRGVHASAAFGFGKHYCSGHAFSRHQIRIALDVLLTRYPAVRPTSATPPEFRGWEFRAPLSLDVHLS